MTPLVEGDAATSTLPSTDGDDQNTEESGSVEGAEDSTLPYDWTGDVESLVLTSHGLEIDMDALAVLVAEHDGATGEEAEPGADAEVDALAASDSDTEAGESESAAERLAGMLPEAVDGELELEFTLDPAAGDEGDDRLAIEPGDYFTVDMPEGVALAEGEALDVFQADGETGKVAIVPSILIAGNTYELTEHAAPAGYELAGTVKFKIEMDGSISIDGAPEDGSATLGEGGSGSYLVVDDNPDAISIVVTDTSIELSLDKVNLRGEKLAGATFEITGVFADGSTESTKTVEVGDDGTISLPRMKAGETYEITELEVPGGYKLIQGSFTFTVNAAGMISAVDNATTQNASGTWLSAGYAVIGDGDELVAVDAPVPSPTPGGDPDDPDMPEDSDDPDTPDTPEEPEDPGDPDTPDPDEPDTPENPDTPEGPDTPGTPDDSVTPDAGADADRPGAAGDSSAGSTNRNDLPQSGDQSWQVACIAACGTAVLAAGLAVGAKRKRSNMR